MTAPIDSAKPESKAVSDLPVDNNPIDAPRIADAPDPTVLVGTAPQKTAIPTTRDEQPCFDAQTLADLLINRAQRSADRIGFSLVKFRGDGSIDKTDLSYGALLARAQAISANLQEHCQPGERALIICPPGLDYIAAFFACQLAGLVPVPASPPQTAEDEAQIDTILVDTSASVILTLGELQSKLGHWVDNRTATRASTSKATIVAVDMVTADDRECKTSLPTRPSHLALLQYTSGTTGVPKAVAITHENVLANLEAFHSLVNGNETDTVVAWLPPRHHMGLVAGVLYPIFAGCRVCLMAPDGFHQKPAQWLRQISMERATLASAPDFAWQLCVDEVDDATVRSLDLSALRAAQSTAESVRSSTLHAFATTFRESGFKFESFLPSYGMAETVSLAVGSTSRAPFLAENPKTNPTQLDAEGGTDEAQTAGECVAKIVSSGSALPAHTVEIVDPSTHRRVEGDQTGEIWLQGPSVAQGYWGRPDETGAVFGARLDDAPERGQWLRTGDLGQMRDGEVYVLGRQIDFIFVGGRYHCARDLEATAEAAEPALGHDRTVVFTHNDGRNEEIVLLHELTRAALRDIKPQRLANGIKRAVLNGHGVELFAIHFVPPASLPRTISGTPLRQMAKECLSKGSFKTIEICRHKNSNSSPEENAASQAADRLIVWLQDFAETDLDSRTWDENRSLPPDLIAKLGKAGLFGVAIPREFGGLGLTHRHLKRVLEQLAAIETTLSVFVGGAACLATRSILRSAKGAMREALLPRLATGAELAAFALSEPGAGSNPRAMTTVARADGSGRWRLTGKKSWVGSGSVADHIVVFCRALNEAGDFDGFSAFVVPGNAEGLTTIREVETMGLRAMVQSELSFNDVSVDSSAMLGSVGDGFLIAQDALSFGRLTLAFGALGGMRRCLQIMHRYASRRTSGIGRLLDHPVSRNRMTSLIAQTEAFDALVTHVADELDSGEVVPADLYSLLKLGLAFHWNAADFLCQLLGDRGYDECNLAAQILRDARVVRIFEGPTEIHQAVVGQNLLDGRSAVPDYLSQRLRAESAEAALLRLVSDLRVTGLASSATDSSTLIPAIANAALYTVLSAALSRKLGSDDAAAKKCLLAEIERLALLSRQAALHRAGAPAPLASDAISRWVGKRVSAIGDVEQQAASGLDPYLRRDPAAVHAMDHTGLHEELFRSSSVPAAARSAAAAPAGAVPIVRRIVAKCTGAPFSAIQPSTVLMDVGVDSLRAGQIIGNLEAETGRSIGIEEFFTARTVDDVAKLLGRAVLRDGDTVPVADRTLAIPLTFQQRRFWDQEQQPGFTGAFSDVTLIDLHGCLDENALTTALQTLIDRHEALRLRIEERDGHPYQVFSGAKPSSVEIEDISGWNEQDRDTQFALLRRQVIDLSASAARVSVLRVNPDHHVVVLAIHHLATDAFTWALLHAELGMIYNAFRGSKRPNLPNPPLQYADYAAWQATHARSNEFNAAIEYWSDVLSHRVPPLHFPFRLRPIEKNDYSLSYVDFSISKEIADQLRQIAKSQNTTLFVVLETAFAIALWGCTAETNVTVGINPNARPQPTFRNVAGLFVAMVPLRHRFDRNQVFHEALAEAQRALLGALKYPLVPFDVIMRAIADRRTDDEQAFAPLQIQFVLHGAFTEGRPNTMALDGVEVSIRHRTRRAARADLTVDLFENEGGSITGSFEYPHHHHDRAGVARFAREYNTLLERLCTSESAPLHQLIESVFASNPTDAAPSSSPSTDETHKTSRAMRRGEHRPMLIPWANRSEALPTAFQQEGLWFLHKLNPASSAAYHIERAFRIVGPLNVNALSFAFDQMVARHESLRTVFAVADDGRPVQFIAPMDATVFSLITEDLSDADEDTLTQRVEAILSKPFDLSAGPLFRARLLSLSKAEYVMVVGGHHSVLDGWSVGLLLKEVSALYREAVTGTPAGLPDLSVQYADYAKWQRVSLSGDRLTQETAWWRKTLLGVPEAITLPFDRPRPMVMDYRGDAVPLHVSADVAAGLNALARSEGATLFMVLEAGFAALLSRLGAGEDVLIGTAVAGRSRRELEDLAGFFVNTLALRTRVDGLSSFREHLKSTKGTVLAAFERQDVPFEAVVQALSPGRAMGHAPLVQVMLVLQNTPDTEAALTLAEVTVAPFDQVVDTAHFELSANLTETAEGLTGTLSYASQVFDRDTVERIGTMFIRLLEAVILTPDVLVADLPLMNCAEQDQVVKTFNDIASERFPDQTVVDLFCGQAAGRPDATALVDGDRTLSYGALDAVSNRLASQLIRLGVGPETVVGVCLERSAELIITLLAIWKAGGAYLPLDPEYPAARLQFMLKDAGAELVLANDATAAVLQGSEPPALSDNQSGAKLALLECLNTADDLAVRSETSAEDDGYIALQKPQHLAYVIYTSGSTGRPKGVMVGHRELHRLSKNQTTGLVVEPTDCVAQVSSIAFDAFFDEVLPAFIQGACVGIISKHDALLPQALATRLREIGATAVDVAPTLLAVLPRPAIASLKRVVTGGETITATLSRELARLTLLFNAYGPTEATVTSTMGVLSNDKIIAHSPGVSIGRPLPGTQVYLVDKRLSPVPVGVEGELLIGGAQVSRGYLGRAGLTAEKFIADPFSSKASARLYRTGDLARWRPDGTLEFLGRIDTQVKIRGMRVELSEIETVLSTCEGVAQAVVSACNNETGDTRLVAYVVPAALSHEEFAGKLSVQPDALTEPERATTHTVPLGSYLSLEAIRSRLKRMLPEHMVPSGFVGLSRVPLTTSGKVDRKALPAADAVVASTTYAAPRSEREALMCAIMREVIAHDRMHLEQVGIDDQFFDIGGHSIFAAQFAMRLEKALGEPVPVSLIFEEPTVRALSARLDERFEASRPAVQRADRTIPIPASFEQERMWLANRIHAGRIVYNEGLPLILRGRVDTQALVAAAQGILDRYEVLRTRLVWQNDRLIQEIDPIGSLKVTFEDWSDRLGPAALEEAALERARTLLSAPYDLAKEHPCRSLVLKLSDEVHAWVLATHHAVGDNWSLSHVMPAVFLALYDSACEGSAADLPAIPLHYADYAVWQRSEAMAPIMDEQLGYWHKTLSGAPEVLDLPSDRPRPAVRDHHGSQVTTERVSAETWRAVERFAVAHDGTPFMVFMAALSALLSRVSGTRDIVIGTPHVMKPDAGLWEEFGYFGNTFALRTEVDLLEPFSMHFERVRQSILSAFAHQDVPFEKVVKELGVARGNATPIFQVMLVMHAFLDEGAFARDDFALEILDAQPEMAKTDLTVNVNPGADGVGLSLQYATDIFDRVAVERLGAMFVRLLAAAISEPNTLAADLPLMNKAERHEVIAGFNDTAAEFGRAVTVPEFFAAQAEARPDAIALVDGARILSYSALDAETNRLARHLLEQGVGPEVVVGVCLERSAELIIALLAIWKAGGAYLPLDPDDPTQRLAYVLDDAGALLVIATSASAANLPDTSSGPNVLVLDAEDTAAALRTNRSASICKAERPHPSKPGILAYIIYTSGSTGRPKGVAVQHAEIFNRLAWMQADYAIGVDDVLLQKTPVTFDVSVWELFWWILAGAKVVMLAPGAHREPAAIATAVHAHRVTSIHFVPSMFEAFLRHVHRHRQVFTSYTTLSRVFTSGETLTSAQVSDFRRLTGGEVDLINLYGPTETTVDVTAHATRSDEPVVPIGAPVSNVEVYVLDDRLEPVALGIPGELVIGGAQVSRGYVGRPGLTAGRFIADPFSGRPGARLYRTGDLGRWRADGTLEFFGRKDTQIKIRGMRVELGEIETALMSCASVAQAVVVARGDDVGEVCLVAHIVPSDVRAVGDERAPQVLPIEEWVDLDDLRAALKQTLPEHMVPAAFVGLRALPLTPSGKVDRNALPQEGATVATAPYAAPRNSREALMCDIMRDVIAHDRLSLERVGIDDHFFDIGGHSIFAAQFAMRLERALAMSVPVRLIFEAPTVRALASRLGESIANPLPPVEPVDRRRPIPASFEQERMWLANSLHENRPIYNEGLALLLTGAVDTHALLVAVQGILDRFDVLRTRLLWQGGRLMQQIDPAGSLAVRFEDWSDRKDPLEILKKEATHSVSTLLDAPYDLGGDHPSRALVIKLSQTVHVWALAHHHAVADNWSLSHVMPAVLFDFYDAARAGREPTIPVAGLSYADYAAWQRSDAMVPVLAEQLDYWRQTLAGAPEMIELPTDRPRPAVREYFGGTISGQGLDPERWRSIERFAVAHDGTPFMVFVAALSALLSRVSRSNDIVIGTPHITKPDARLWGEFGYFGNHLVLRTSVDPLNTFSEHFDSVRGTVLSAFRHQEVPFEEVLKALGSKPANATPIFQVALVMHAFLELGAFSREDFSLQPLRTPSTVAKTDLSLDMDPSAQGVDITLEYASDIFEEATVRRLGVMFVRLLESAIEAPDQLVANLSLLDDVERHQVVSQFNAPAVNVAPDCTVVDLFNARVAACPDAIAVVDGNRTLTYGALDVASNRLARQLIEHGVRPGDTVGVCLERSTALLVTLLAIWKAGAAYVPFDANEPQSRLASTLGDAGARVLILVDHLDTSQFGARTIRTASEVDAAALSKRDRNADVRLQRAVSPNSVGTLLFTSGSSGVPKGVAISHGALAAAALNCAKELGVNASSAVLQQAAIRWIASLDEVLPILVSGGTIHLACGEPTSMWQQACRERVTHVVCLPDLLRFARHSEELRGLKIAVVGARPRFSDLASASKIALIKNDYGSTEYSSSLFSDWVSTPHDLTRLHPLDGTAVYVVDQRFETCPIGIAGELLVAGKLMAHGYANAPSQTAERFVANPFCAEAGARLYRTGDLARWRTDGTIEILGRIDSQVKIRGMRVELGEIEAALGTCKGVQEAAVTASQDEAGDVRLVAYLVPSNGEITGLQSDREVQASRIEVLSVDSLIDLQDIRSELKRILPEHMIPAAFVALSRMPVTASGKVDRSALPRPPVAVAEAPYVAPEGSMEVLITAAFQEILGLERVGRNDDFFALGGHSLMAVRLVTRLEIQTGKSMSIATVVAAPTVAELAKTLDEQQPSPGQVALAPTPEDFYKPFPLTDVQTAYYLGRQGTGAISDVSCFVFVALSFPDLDTGRLEQVLDELVAAHPMLRTTFSADLTQHHLRDVPAVTVPLVDLSKHDPSEAEDCWQALLDELSHQVLPADQWPLFQARAIKMPGAAWRLTFGIDLLIADAVSLSLITKQLLGRYLNTIGPIVSPSLTFRDVVLHAASERDGPRREGAASYWRARLDNLPTAPQLPLNVTSSALARTRFERREFHLGIDDWAGLKAFAAEASVTPTSVLVTAYSSVLATWSQSDDFLINLTVMDRKPLHPDMDAVIGDFTTIILLAVSEARSGPFSARVARLQAQLMCDLDHIDYSAIQVLRDLTAAGRSPGDAHVVFTSTLGAQGADDALSAAATSSIEVLARSSQTPQVLLDCQVSEGPNGLLIAWDAPGAHYPKKLLDDMFGALASLVERLSRDRAAWDSDDPLPLPSWQTMLMEAANATSGPCPDEKLQDGFFAWAAEMPEQIAITGLPDEGSTLDYRTLAHRSLLLSERVAGAVSDRTRPVAILMKKGWEQVASAIAILEAGSPFLPISAEQPAERIGAILSSAAVQLVLTTPDLHPQVTASLAAAEVSANTAVVTAETLDVPPARQRPTAAGTTPDDLAYVIYTSGSTGQPKGVMIKHRAAVNTLADLRNRFALCSRDKVLWVSDLSFDLSIFDLFGLFGVGGTVVVPAEGSRREPSLWVNHVARYGVTVWNSVPQLAEMAVGVAERMGVADLSTIRLMMLSGDWLPVALPDRVRQLSPSCRVTSLGGATEASIWSILYSIGDVDPSWSSIPYGKPLTNQTFHVLRKDFSPCPVHVPGTLFIGGQGLSEGYIDDPETTAKKFLQHPLTGERLYDTGDRGVYRPSGDIEFLGREDDQVKIRGHRVELGEINTAMMAHPDVEAAIAVAVGPRDDRRLAAYIVPKAQADAWDPSEPDIIAKPGMRAAFTLKSHGRPPRPDGAMVKPLPGASFDPTRRAAFLSRQSYRVFEGNSLSRKAVEDWLETSASRGQWVAAYSRGDARLSASSLGSVFASLQAMPVEGALLPKRRYGSAGGLYPARAYLILDEPIDDFRRGIYTYDPFEHSLIEQAGGSAEDGRYALPASLREVPTIVLVGHLPAIRPLYGTWSDTACRLEAGGMVRVLADAAMSEGQILMPLPKEDDLLRKVLQLGSATEDCPIAVFGIRDRKDVSAPNLEAMEATLDIFLDVKPGAVNGLEPGVYHHVPGRGLVATKAPGLQADAIKGANRPVYDGAGLTILLTHRANVSAKNGLDSEGAGCVLLGEAAHSLSELGPASGIGLCALGGIAAQALDEGFRLNDSKVERGPLQRYTLLAGAITAQQSLSWSPSQMKPHDPDDPLGARQWLSKRLPQHMVPIAFGVLDELPLSPTGKVDRKALPEVAIGSSRVAYVPPEGETESRVSAIIAELVGAQQVGRHDDFFDLGGNSLIAAQLAARLGAELGKSIAVGAVFDTPTVAGLAALLDDTGQLEPDEEDIKLLLEDPTLAPKFDALFGAGSSAKYLSR